MSTRLSNGVWKPPEVRVELEGIRFQVWPTVPTVRSLSIQAGAAIGTCRLGYPTRYMEDAAPEAGKAAVVRLGGRVIFRGVVGDFPGDVDPQTDETLLLLYDDKHTLQGPKVGQIGIGSQGEHAGHDGFADVAFDITFNRDGRPNMDPDADPPDFRSGTGAEYWTLADILVFLFAWYIPAAVATLDPSVLGNNWDVEPSHLCLTGHSVLQAIDLVAKCAGQSWALMPNASASEFVSVRTGYGALRTFHIFRPKRGGRASDVTDLYPRRFSGGKSIRDCVDVYQAISAPIVKETTYRSDGTDPLLVEVSTFKDVEYKYRFKIDVAKYAAHNLGANLSAGSRPKPILPTLVTRLKSDGSGYLTAAQISATPLLGLNDRVSKPCAWLIIKANDEEETTLSTRLITGGIRLDAKHGHLDLKATIKLAPMAKTDPPTADENYVVSSAPKFAIMLTCATILEQPEWTTSDDAAAYLPNQQVQMIEKRDLVPERREAVLLPDLDREPNDMVLLAANAEEKYIDVGGQLENALELAEAMAPQVESPLKFEFPFFPTLALGDLVAVRGRDIGAEGNEVIVELGYDFRGGVPDVLRVSATNVLSGVDPSRFREVP